MTKQDCEHNNYQTKNNTNTRTLRNWTIVWVITMAIAAFAPRFIWDFNTSLTIITLLINLAVGFRMLVANRKYLRGLDEMQQKILFDAMAFTLGVGLVIGLSYELLEDIKLIGFEPEISHLIIVMCLTYLTAIIAGHRKYR
ncbi:hypothetical protein ESZ36_07620 [Colwellia demingiae]|uniref:Uncharacterized protein n=1 Tax=Colwellia demingiae TaxID=89401 RepID=A0A5C6QLB4_9GAMM|nr:hypothetical protein [Colwellia demingiae]TWX69804.1 hypothetical protein ESZ36_07620 [Colwellia demingiae]